MANFPWQVVGPVATVIVAIVAALSATAWLNRRNIARLTQAQAGGEDAKTAEMIDRMARDWLSRLEAELREERTIRVYSIAYIERLISTWKVLHPEDASRIPPIPHELVEYLGGS